MPTILTRYFGPLECSPNATFRFNAGIPGFEDHTDFVFIQQPQTKPLVFMQSMRDPSVCFVELPAAAVDPEYRLDLSPEEANALGLPEGEPSGNHSELISLVMLSLVEKQEPVVNLMSPIVLNPRTSRGIQAIQLGSNYSLRHPLAVESQAVPCS